MPGQRIKELFNFRLYLCQLHLIGGQFRVGLFLTAPKVFEIPEFLSHSGKYKLFKFHFAESAAPRTALVVGPFITPEVFIAGRVAGDF